MVDDDIKNGAPVPWEHVKYDLGGYFSLSSALDAWLKENVGIRRTGWVNDRPVIFFEKSRDLILYKMWWN